VLDVLQVFTGNRTCPQCHKRSVSCSPFVCHRCPAVRRLTEDGKTCSAVGSKSDGQDGSLTGSAFRGTNQGAAEKEAHFATLRYTLNRSSTKARQVGRAVND
jgi:hypothetical protein